MLSSLVDRDDILETGRVGMISADFAIDLDQTLSKDSSCLSAVQRILQTVSDEDDQWQAVAGFLLTLLVFVRVSMTDCVRDEREDQVMPWGHRHQRACPKASARER